MNTNLNNWLACKRDRCCIQYNRYLDINVIYETISSTRLVYNTMYAYTLNINVRVTSPGQTIRAKTLGKPSTGRDYVLYLT